MPPNEEDDRDITYIAPSAWRSRLGAFLQFLSSIEKQKKVLVKKSEKVDFDPPYTAFEIWFDVHTYYMERMHFEDGMENLVQEGFINAEEAKALKPLDDLLQNFFPDDLMTENALAVITDPKWVKIAEMATVLCKKFK